MKAEQHEVLPMPDLPPVFTLLSSADDAAARAAIADAFAAAQAEALDAAPVSYNPECVCPFTCGNAPHFPEA